MKNDTDYEDSLKHSGLKNTKNRIAILAVLERSKIPLTAEQVYFELKEKNISINLSTVYRTLETLSDKKMVTKLSLIGDNRTLFEYNRMEHRHYLVCVKCRKIMAIDRCPLESYEKILAEETDFTIFGHKLDVYGYCPECRKQDKCEK